MAILLSDARTSFERLKHDISDVTTATFVEWCDWINRAFYNKVSILEPDKFVQSQSYTVTTTPQTSALPADFKNIGTDGTGVFYVDSNSNDTSTILALTGFGSTKDGYYFNGSNIVFTGQENQTYKLKYIPTETKLTSVNQYFTLDGLSTGTEIIDERYLQFVVKALDVFYNQWDEMPGAESLADFRFVRLLDEVLSDYRKAPTVYSMHDYSVNY